jgi:hypothetical protein
MHARLTILATLSLFACSTGTSVVNKADTANELRSQDQGRQMDQVDSPPPDLAGEDLGVLDIWAFDGFVNDTVVPECAPGEGCFLDPCSENAHCLSTWCVEHMGDDVCTISCSEECPPGWTCKQVAESGADLVFACVSDHATLCKPCVSGADCAGTAGGQGTCVDYHDQGSFCGGKCAVDADCPWGFSCADTHTVDGIATRQCVADAGVCPCTDKAVAAALFTPCELTNAFGACSGKRVCTEEGLSDCDAALPAEEICNGLDDDCDGEVDEPNLVDGDYVNLCKDANSCTEDKCLGLDGCEHVALDGVECADGNPCTIADTCKSGVCGGTTVDCNDDNPCTDDSCNEAGGCQYLANTVNCDDNDPCTVADRCEDSQCSGVTVPCDCQSDQDCESLEDGDLCNGSLFCDQATLPYKCSLIPDSVIDCPLPSGPNGPCLATLCDGESGQCEFAPANDGASCNDGDLCTVSDTCLDGICTAGQKANCNDGNPCTDDGCQEDTGCLHVNNEKDCFDGNVCTIDDQCSDGACIPGTPLSCDDDNACTLDECAPKTGCMHTAQAGPCSDGNACTSGDTCQAGKCVAKGNLDCDDQNPCTADSCHLLDGCQHAVVAGFCDDGDSCTLGDQCVNGLCQGGEALVCNDSNPCTDDSCDSGKCLFVPNNAPCDDGNACTLSDTCKAGKCSYGSLLQCDDDNLCTTDACDPGEGCLHLLNNAPCDDGDVCTTGDICHLGECSGTGALPCDDQNPCTTDSCAPGAGCQFVPNSAPCSDGNACTQSDSCKNGWCAAGPAVDCNDDNACTNDTCDPAEGCLHAVNTDYQTDPDNCGECGTVCSQKETCQGGKCLANHGEPCLNNGECLSNVCRLDWDGAGTFCAQDTESCVLAIDAPAAGHVPAGGIRCGNGGHKACADGTWGQLLSCLGTSCITDQFTPAQGCVDDVGCTPSQTADCSPFVCDNAGCKESCNDDADCTGEFVCNGSQCIEGVINAPNSIRPGSEYYGPSLPGYTQCAGWKNTSSWDILTCNWIHSCAASGKTLRFRLHDGSGQVVFDETFPSFSQTEMNSNLPGCDSNGYGICGKQGASGKALLIFKPANGNGGCHGDDNSSGAVRISSSTNGNNMGNNTIFLGGKRCSGATYRDHKYSGTDPISEIRWMNGATWDGCSHNGMVQNYAITVYLSN